MYVSVYMWVCAHVYKCLQRPEGSMMVMSHQMWALGAKLRISVRAVCTLNCQAYSSPKNINGRGE